MLLHLHESILVYVLENFFNFIFFFFDNFDLKIYFLISSERSIYIFFCYCYCVQEKLVQNLSLKIYDLIFWPVLIPKKNPNFREIMSRCLCHCSLKVLKVGISDKYRFLITETDIQPRFQLIHNNTV